MQALKDGPGSLADFTGQATEKAGCLQHLCEAALPSMTPALAVPLQILQWVTEEKQPLFLLKKMYFYIFVYTRVCLYACMYTMGSPVPSGQKRYQIPHTVFGWL